MYFPTQEDINLMKQRENVIDVVVKVLDMDFLPIGEIEGEVTSDNFSFDVDSEIRKSMTLEFVVRENSINIGDNKKLWINKYIRILLKKKDLRTGRFLEYDRGMYVLQDYSLSYSTSEYKITLKCADIVCLYNGDISGSLKGQVTRIVRDELVQDKDTNSGTGKTEGTTTPETEKKIATVRSAMLKIMEWAGIKKYKIGNMDKEFPYDKMDFSASQTWWDMVTEVRDLYPGWETFFDLDGTFICQPIPTTKDDIVILDNNFWQDLVISENVSCDLFSVKNATKVWGKCLTCEYFAESVTYDSNKNTYTANFKNLPVEKDGNLSTGVSLAMEIPENNKKEPKVIITNTVSDKKNTIGTFNLVTDSFAKLEENKLNKGTTYVFRYRRKQVCLQGQWQLVAVCYLVAKEPTKEIKDADIAREGTKNIQYVVNPDSPFCREYIGERMQVLSAGDYEIINSDEKVKERAEFENWQSARTVYTLNLNTIFVPFIYGNEKIGYTLKSNGESKEWIIKTLSGSWTSGTMSLSLIEFYPLYPFVVKES